MDYNKVKEVAERYRHDILGYARATRVAVKAERMSEVFAKYPQKNVPKLTELNHHLWMCEEILRGEMSLTKAMRWLGWLNFFVYQQGWFTLEEVKELSRPIDEEKLNEATQAVGEATADFVRKRVLSAATKMLDGVKGRDAIAEIGGQFIKDRLAGMPLSQAEEDATVLREVLRGMGIKLVRLSSARENPSNPPLEEPPAATTYDLHDPAEHGECVDLHPVKRSGEKP